MKFLVLCDYRNNSRIDERRKQSIMSRVKLVRFTRLNICSRLVRFRLLFIMLSNKNFIHYKNVIQNKFALFTLKKLRNVKRSFYRKQHFRTSFFIYVFISNKSLSSKNVFYVHFTFVSNFFSPFTKVKVQYCTLCLWHNHIFK